MKMTIAKWLLLTALLCYVGFITAWARSLADARTCTSIDVEILHTSAPDSITLRGVMQEISKYPRPIVGQPASKLRVGEIERYLGRLSNFESIQCALSPAGKLIIKIVPMVPVLRVFDGPESYYINKDGKRIEANADFFVDVPVVSGRFSADFSPIELLPVVRFIQADSTLRTLFSMVSATNRDNIMLTPRIQGHLVCIGDTTSLPSKFHNLLLMYRKVMPFKGWMTYDTISVKYRNQIVASRRDKTPAFAPVVFEENEDPEEASLPTDDSPNNTANTANPATT